MPVLKGAAQRVQLFGLHHPRDFNGEVGAQAIGHVVLCLGIGVQSDASGRAQAVLKLGQ